MMKWIKKHNLGSKALALLGAVTLWFLISASSEEDTTRVFGSIPVQLNGVDTLLSKGYVILDGASPLATVSLTGPMRRISVVAADIDLIKAFVDVSSLVPGQNAVRFSAYIDLDDPGLTITERRPSQLYIVVDRIVDMAVPVELVLSGKPESSYRIDSYDVWPTMVTLNGPESYLKDVKYARVSYDVSGMTDSDSVNLVFELVKEDGGLLESNKLSWIKADVASVELTLDVRCDSMVNLRVAFSGMPDYLNEDAIDHFIDPGSISVTGEPGVIESLNYIDLGEINIRQIIENGVSSVEKTISLPNGVSSSMNGKTAVIYISFPGYDRKVFNFTNEVLPEKAQIEYPEQAFDITVFGLNEDLALVRASDFVFTPIVDTAQLEPGNYTIPMQVVCNIDGVAVLGKYTVNINVLEPEDTEPGSTDEPVGENNQ